MITNYGYINILVLPAELLKGLELLINNNMKS